MIRSLLITRDEFPPHRGGISTLMAGLAKSLGPGRVSCCVGLGMDHAEDDLGLKVHRTELRGCTGIAWDTRFAWAIASAILSERPDVLQFSAIGDAAYVGPFLRHWAALPYVVYAHDTEILIAHPSGWRRTRQAMLAADAIIVLSSFTAGLAKEAGMPPEKVHQLQPGCDVDRFAPGPPDTKLRERLLGGRPTSRLLLSVGSLRARKGQDVTIRALASLSQRHPDVGYLIVGSGPDRPRLEGLATELGILDRVFFFGSASEDQLPELYRQADVFVMPSRRDRDAGFGAGFGAEGFGLVFLEAAAAGLPVIGGRSGGVSDAVVDGRTGLLVNPEAAEEVAAAICQLLEYPDEARRLGEAGRDRVLGGFTWSHFSDSVDRLLHQIMEQRNKPLA